MSGGTDLYNIFAEIGSSGSTVSSVGVGNNIINQGSSSNPIIALTPSISINSFISSGLTTINSNLIVNLSAEDLCEKIVWFFSLSINEKFELSNKLKEICINYTEENAIKFYKETFEKIGADETNNI